MFNKSKKELRKNKEKMEAPFKEALLTGVVIGFEVGTIVVVASTIVVVVNRLLERIPGKSEVTATNEKNDAA